MPSDYRRQILFNQGLRPDKSLRHVSGFCTTLKNAAPTEFGLEAPTDFYNPISDSYSFSWPLPQLLYDNGPLLLAGASSISSVSEVGALTPLSLYQATSPGSSGSITVGGKWDYVLVNDRWWLASNGSCLVYKLPSNPSSKVLVSSAVAAKALCQHKQQGILYIGGLSGSAFSGSRWTELVEAWKLHTNLSTFYNQTTGNNWVLWVRDLDFDYPFRNLIDALDLEGTSSADKTKQVIKTAFEQRRMGLVSLPTTGGVLQLLPIADRVIAYTERGVFSISEGESGFKWQRLSEEGVYGRGCACGDLDHHYYLARNGYFWKHSMNGEFSRRGYQEFGAGLAGASVVASFDEVNRRWYFADGTSCVVLTDSAAYTLTKFPTSIISYKGDLAAIENSPVSTEFELETLPSALGANGSKDLRFIEVICQGLSNARVRVGWRQKETDAIKYLPWVPGSPEGTFWGGVAGTEFVIGLKGTLAATGKVEELNAGIIYADARSVRGPRAIGAEGQAG